MIALREFDTVVFDFDGTLVDGLDAIEKFFMLTAEKLFLDPPDRELIRLEIGRPLHDVIASLLNSENEHLLEDFINIYRKFAREILPVETKLRPHIPDLLYLLHSKGIKMGIATTKHTNSTILTLKNLGADHYFGSICGVDKIVHPKPDPEQLFLVLDHLDSIPEKSIMVGDTYIDVMAATNAGMISVAVKDGYGEKDKLIESKPQYLLEDVREMKELFMGYFQ